MNGANIDGPAARGSGHIAPAPAVVTTPAPGADRSVDAQLHLSRHRYSIAGDTGKVFEPDTAATLALKIYAAGDRGEAITAAFIEMASQGAPRELFRQALGLLFDMDDAVDDGGHELRHGPGLDASA